MAQRPAVRRARTCDNSRTLQLPWATAGASLLLAVAAQPAAFAQQPPAPPAAVKKAAPAQARPAAKARPATRSAPAAPTDPAEVPRGGSRELGIEFEVVGGKDWCRANPVVRLKAASPSAFKPRDVLFQQMIGRIRAVVAGQCSIIESLSFDGTVDGAPVFAAETAKHTRWRHLVVLDPATRRPHCLFGQEAHPDCPRRAQAYVVARQALNPIALPDLELTTVLDPRAPVHLGWRSGGATGKLMIAEGDQLADYFESATALAESYLEELGEGCKERGGTLAESWILDGFKEITLGGFECHKEAARETAVVVVVAGTAAGFDIFSLTADKADPESVKSMGWGIALAIKDRGW